MKLCTSLRALLVAPLALPLAALLPSPPTALAAPAAATSVKSAMKFTLPSGRIVYKMNSTGARPANGTITMTWTNNGMPLRQDIEVNTGRPGSRVPPTSVWMIFDGRTAYLAVPAMGKIAFKMAPNSEQLKRVAGGVSAINSDARGGKVVGKGTILGKPCEIRQLTVNTARGTSQTKVWLWQGLPLRTETTNKGTNGAASTMTLAATKVDTALKPSPSLFKVPADYKVQDMSAMLGQIMGSMGKQR